MIYGAADCFYYYFLYSPDMATNLQTNMKVFLHKLMLVILRLYVTFLMGTMLVFWSRMNLDQSMFANTSMSVGDTISFSIMLPVEVYGNRYDEKNLSVTRKSYIIT